MKYKKFEIGSYNLHIVKTENFKINRMVIQFKRSLVKEEITKRNLLVDVLTSATKKYNTERLMNIKTEELYGLPFSGSTYISGNFAIMKFYMEFLNDKFIPNSIFSESIDFMMDILFDPDIIDNKFDEKIFEVNKKNMEDNINSFNDNPRSFSMRRLMEEISKETTVGYHGNGYVEDLKKIDPEELYKYYKSVLQKDIVDVFIIGDLDINEVKNVIVSKMKINTIKKNTGTHYIKHKEYRKKCKSIIEKKNINQSKLVVGCKLKDLTEFEINYVSNIYSFILGGSPNSILFQNVREKNSLCYYITSSVSKINNILTIESGIDKKDYKKCVRLIKKEIKNMSLGKFDEQYIENGKITYLNACKEICDSPRELLNVYISNEYLHNGLLDDKEKEIMKVDKKSIMDFAKKVYMDVIYLLEGVDDNEC